jgi:hypothetical protein
MGKGLIPADPVTWSKRRRQIVPGFHKGASRWYQEFERMKKICFPICVPHCIF